MTETNELDALIVEHIADLEGAWRRLVDTLDPRLLHEASETIHRKTDALGWLHEFVASDDYTIFAPQEWTRQDDAGQVAGWSSWFELGSTNTDGNLTHQSSLAEFLNLSGGSTCKSVSFRQDLLGKTKWRAILNGHAETAAALRNLGFNVDERQGTISTPVSLNPTLLREGLLNDDLELALAPVDTAFEQVVKALPHFQVLAASVRVGNDAWPQLEVPTISD